MCCIHNMVRKVYLYIIYHHINIIWAYYSALTTCFIRAVKFQGKCV